MTISINYSHTSPETLDYEVVERKGLGHPDTLADGIAELAEIEYSKYCLSKFGCIPHHNFDKLMILGGNCEQKFGKGVFKNPIQVIFMGRGTKDFNGIPIPLKEIQIASAKKYIKRVLPHLNVEDPKMITFDSVTSNYTTKPFWFKPRDINDLPEYSEDGPFANDTATMISYWPLTPCEQIALFLESYFYLKNEDDLPYPRFKEFGGDIKVMVVRDKDEITATLAVPQVTTFTHSKDEYISRLKSLKMSLESIVSQNFPHNKIKLIINPSDSLYLVTAGSCIDFGEEGAVGRGNKTHGIISSFRPNTMEAPHGKNSTYFVGKVLGYQADKIAKDIYDTLNIPCQVILRANIGDKLYSPSKIIVSTTEKVDKKIIEKIVLDSLSLKRKTTDILIESQPFLPNFKQGCYYEKN
ncbi:S-adenosylmethionine synthetase [Macrococcoides bohemicum]|uniref:methionine adenosyltransferase n=1 Tax=Macrococcoides bohemicum TaxID=1903056 RepID=UPI00105A4DE2|nr:methionine adenosyltransferase [Macrococcus bohemicus]TDL33463.1 S-adenosylmethionine synthetase [Macrococcus bohemicus]